MQNLTGKDIVAIIKAGRQAGVSSLKLAELEINYEGKEKPKSEPEQLVFSEQESSKTTPPEEINHQQLIKELQLELLHTTDPQEYEKRVFGVNNNG